MTNPESNQISNIDTSNINGVGNRDATSQRPRRNKKQVKKTRINLTGLLVKILLILLISLFLASLASFIALEFLSGSNLFGLKISGKVESDMLLFVFAGTFCISAVLMNFAYATPRQLAVEPRTQTQIKRDPNKPNTPNTPIKQNKRDLRKHLSDVMAGSKEFVLEEPETKVTAEQFNEVPPDQSKVATDPLEKEVKQPSSDEITHETFLIDFLENSLTQSNHALTKISNFDKFGINLFLAGACEVFSGDRNLTELSRKQILSVSIEFLGTMKSHAATFIDKYQDYVVHDPDYMQMYQSGRNAMITHIQDPKNSLKCLKIALENWNLPKGHPKENRSITVLSSNISGAEKTAQSSVSTEANEALKTHNQIVRAALTIKKGLEIKHTGYGIVASFDQVSDSVDAAIRMQREASNHNKISPNEPLHLKIGINTGDTFLEGVDHLATVAQLSSSILGKAQAGEILVSDDVRGICKGKGYNFSSKGNHEIQGQYASLHLYEVLWHG